MQHTICVNHIEDLPRAAEQLLALCAGKKVLAFYGAMGAGKTTFIKTLCRLMGVNDNVSSPTFSLVNEYLLPGGKKIFHFDFYRIKSESEAFDMGYEDYFYSGNYCFIEWPEKIAALLPGDIVTVTITVGADDTRLITVVCPE